jgi:MATE family multidrug resistance protein
MFLAQGSSTILQFIDRMFLTWYNPQALAASAPSGMLAFTVQALFIGLVGYVSVFVAQYTGAGKPRQAVSAVWHAFYLALLASLCLLPLVPLGGKIFLLAGHAPAVQGMERAFYTVLLRGAFVFIAPAALNGYFIGRGKTRIVLQVNLVMVVVNVLLDYLLIFGHGGLPALGITGAALASVCASGVGLILVFFAFLRETWTHPLHGAWKPNPALLFRLLRYGTSNGVQLALDMIAWTTFILLVGRLGVQAQGATSLAFLLNSFAFFPIMGFSMAATTLVGKNLGRNRPDLANRAVWSAIHTSLCFVGGMALLYLLVPAWLLAPFAAQADPVAFQPVRAMTIIMLRFVAAYCLFDVGNVVFAAALKGAGDTLFVMLLSTSCAIMLLLVPIALWCIRPGGLGIFGAWSFVTLDVIVLAGAFLWRYLTGHWRSMRVIERDVID